MKQCYNLSNFQILKLRPVEDTYLVTHLIRLVKVTEGMAVHSHRISVNSNSSKIDIPFLQASSISDVLSKAFNECLLLSLTLLTYLVAMQINSLTIYLTASLQSTLSTVLHNKSEIEGRYDIYAQPSFSQ